MYNIPNGHKIFKFFPIYVRPSKIYTNWEVWFENKPSGNPALYGPTSTDLFTQRIMGVLLKN
jgi:hypothetical protein